MYLTVVVMQVSALEGALQALCAMYPDEVKTTSIYKQKKFRRKRSRALELTLHQLIEIAAELSWFPAKGIIWAGKQRSDDAIGSRRCIGVRRRKLRRRPLRIKIRNMAFVRVLALYFTLLAALCFFGTALIADFLARVFLAKASQSRQRDPVEPSE